jgi:uncharacterized protein involved in outer membrane biogenesis
MSSTRNRILFAMGGAVALLVLVALAVPLLVDVNRYKPQLEVAASTALEMDVRIGGRLSAGLLPSPSITVEDGHVLDTLGMDVASVRRTRCWFRLLPLLRGELRVSRVELTQPRLSIERDAEGGLNVERMSEHQAL